MEGIWEEGVWLRDQMSLLRAAQRRAIEQVSFVPGDKPGQHEQEQRQGGRATTLDQTRRAIEQVTLSGQL